MGKKNKKKGQGIIKTMIKTEKNALKREKKLLAQSGEKFIDEILNEFSTINSQLKPSIIENCPPPCPRSCASLVAHPSLDVLFLFGGEKYSKNKVEFLDDFYNYDIRKSTWSRIIAPNGPLPRSSHQMICSDINGGSLWVFGGEFINPTESQFHHFSDLWEFSLRTKNWREFKNLGSPTTRSGHRMVLWHRRNVLLIFGGFQMTKSVSRWFNDILAFDVIHHSWLKVEVDGIVPSPRSGSAFVSAGDDQFFIYGGFSNGVVLDDLFSVTMQRDGSLKAFFSRVDVGGPCRSPPRSGFGFCSIGTGRIVIFGGSRDCSENEEETSEILSDVFVVDAARKRRFVPQISPVVVPLPRINSSLCCKSGMIYLFGGFYDSDEYTEMFGDFYSIDLFKLDTWNLLIPQSADSKVLMSDSDGSQSEESMDISE